MANPIGNGGTHYRQERYGNLIVPLMRKEFVVRSRFRRDYEGNPVAGAVNIPVRNTEVMVADYNISTGVPLTQSATTFISVLITKNKAVNEIIDGYEAEAVPDDLRAQRLESAAYSLGNVLELNAILELETNGTASSSTGSDVYSCIKNDVITQKGKGIKTNELVIFVSADTESSLLDDDKFANSSGSLGAELLRSGVIGKIAGVEVVPCYNLTTGTDYIVLGTPWAQSIDEWKVDPTINTLSNNYIGASAVQGRMVYEDKLTSSDACLVHTGGFTS